MKTQPIYGTRQGRTVQGEGGLSPAPPVPREWR